MAGVESEFSLCATSESRAKKIAKSNSNLDSVEPSSEEFNRLGVRRTADLELERECLHTRFRVQRIACRRQQLARHVIFQHASKSRPVARRQRLQIDGDRVRRCERLLVRVEDGRLKFTAMDLTKVALTYECRWRTVCVSTLR
jgi:predicted ester cyclase